MKPHIIEARNVNDALGAGLALFAGSNAAWQTGRANAAGSLTIEHQGVVITTYAKPRERVLFSPRRNANPFFHFFEALWILAGRNDVHWIAHFNKRMAEFADAGQEHFHGAYGHRLREPFDQLRWAISTLEKEPDSRRVVLVIFDPERDHQKSRDIPCNVALSFLVRDNALHLTVYCRSNDMIWGAYGANVVQFSTILEFIAQSLQLPVGTYTQVSNSFHVYDQEPTWLRMSRDPYDFTDPYQIANPVHPYDLMHGIPAGGAVARAARFVTALDSFMYHSDRCIQVGSLLKEELLPYFSQVARPLFNAWQCYKAGDISEAKTHVDQCHASDWKLAALSWLQRTRLAPRNP